MDVAAELLEGKVLAGARAIRWLDDRDPRGAAVIEAIFPHTGKAHLVGITGPPGAGKSTLSDMLIAEARKRARRVGVIAVDPSSPFTGGAILGDRVRMGRHALDPGVFIRSIGTRGQMGGLSRSTHDAALVLDAMGYDLILIETVGVGQDEIDVVTLAHTTVIVTVPGLGDEVQAVKAGLMEAGEIFVINKADREGHDATVRQLEMMLHLRSLARPDQCWQAPLLSAVASKGQGIPELLDVIEAHRTHLADTGEFARRLAGRERAQMISLLRDRVLDWVVDNVDHEMIGRLETRELDPYRAADALFRMWERR